MKFDHGNPWFAGLGFWCRLWQAQLEQSMKVWAVWAEALPKPSAADLAAEAEKMRELSATPTEPARPARSTRNRAAPPAPTAATVH
jgi:hypothetical protein